MELLRRHTVEWRLAALEGLLLGPPQLSFLLGFERESAFFAFDFSLVFCLPAVALILFRVLKSATLDVPQQRQGVIKAVAALGHLFAHPGAHSRAEAVLGCWLWVLVAVSARTEGREGARG
jgi:hypothetical protein